MSEEAHELPAEESQEVSQEESQEESQEVSEQVVESSDSAPESEEDLQGAVDSAIEEGASVEEVKEIIKEYQLKVNGKTLTKTLDLSDDEAVRKELQLAAAGRQSMQEAAELKKIYAQEIDRLKADPYAVLEELGIDADELAELRIQQRIEEMKKSPEQIEQEKLRSELDEARSKLKVEEEKSQKAEMSRLQEKAATDLDDEISGALEAHATLPNSAYTVKKIADVMLWAMDNGWDDVTVGDVIPTVENEIKSDINQLMTELPDEMLEAYIGQKTTERLRKKRVATAKQTESVKNIKSTASKTEPAKDRPKIRIDDWMRS